MHKFLPLAKRPDIKVITLSIFTLLISIHSNAQWAWLKGNSSGYWGTRGVASGNNQPSPRYSYATCSDGAGNLWLFGGLGPDINGHYGKLNDLWQYSSSANKWTWVSGKSDNTIDIVSTYGIKGVADDDNVPGVRTDLNIWTDAAGKIWIWGGNGIDVNGNNGSLNDLWKYDPTADQWTWVNGSDMINDGGVYGIRGVPDDDNQPAYMSATNASDRFGNLWLTGNRLGFELWKYTTSTNQWTFLGKNNYYGIYGTKGVAATENVPGYRYYHSSAVDSAGKLLIFGGYGYGKSSTGQLNDLWQYNPATDKWMWVSGSDNPNQIGIYGTQGIPDAKNHPGARYNHSISIDKRNNNVFVYGGNGYSGLGTNGNLNDLWNYNSSSGKWTWLSGSKGTDQGTVYGIKEVFSTNNHPGASYYPAFIFNSYNKVFFYGPSGYNDVWSYINNIAPIVKITSPDNNATFTAPASITLTATASDTDGTINYVQFFNGTSLLKTDSTSPYTYLWADVPEGNYTITAKAKDNIGLTVTSAAVNITVAANKAPTVALTSPDSTATFTAPATINVAATASDSDGSVNYIQFFNGTTLLYTDSVSPYAYLWTNVAAGNYSLTAKAIDNGGLTNTSATVNIFVSANKAPTITITSPDSNSVYISPANINISAAADDSDGTINYVQFFNGATLLQTDSTFPYSYIWTNVPAGNYSITAIATDNGGSTTQSAAVNLLVIANKAPLISITSPDSNAVYVSPADITISTAASDSDGTISYVQFYNGTTLLQTDSISPYSYLWSNVAAGDYEILAKAVDNGGATATTSINISVVSNKAPVVNLTSPDSGAVYIAPANITLTAAASDSDGTISYVQFYNGATLLATDSTSPYTFTWHDVPEGNCTITAIATDNNGQFTTSASVNISVVENKAPVVKIITPVNNATYTAPASVTISAAASDSDGTIKYVQFYNGATLLGTDSTSPYSYSWLNIAKGNYSISAKVVDNFGLSTTSSIVNITVAINKAPYVTLTSPAYSTIFTAPATIILNAEASDTDGTIKNVKFYSNSQLLATDSTSPYSYTLNAVPSGNYYFLATATDNSGLTTNSASVFTSVLMPPNKAPVVEITDPVNNASYTAPAALTIKAAAVDPDGTITSVKFYNGSTLLATDSTSPYSYTINNANAASYKFYAQATDNDGLKNSSATVSVFKAAPDAKKAPSVSITSPANNAIYAPQSTITLQAAASDLDGIISSVKFYNGSTLLKTDNTNPYTCTVNDVTTGNYSFVALATDNSGLVSNSSTVNVRVGGPANKAPTVNITGPANNATYNVGSTVTVNATASDPDGTINNVKFYNGGTLLKTDSSNPYSYEMVNAAAGTYKFYVKATDSNGLANSSGTVTVFVVPGTLNKAPTVSLVNPVNNTIYYSPAAVSLSAAASDEDGTIANVKFYIGSTLLGTDNVPPYNYTLTNLLSGTYSFVAKATDNNGLESNSATAVVFVSALPDKAPGITLSSPVNNATYTAPASIVFNATASDPDGTITSVKFYNGATLLSTDSTSPYNYTLNNAGEGNFKFYAKATDDKGLTTTTSTAYVVVAVADTPICSLSSQPTFGYIFNGKLTGNINNGLADPSESASVIICDGGQYVTSGHFHSSSYNLYNMAFTRSGGIVFADNWNPTDAIWTSDQMTNSGGTHTLNLADPNIGGTFVQTITPFKDLNNNGILDSNDCAGEPIVYTHTATPCGSMNNLSLQRSADVENKLPQSDLTGMMLAPNPAHNIINIHTTGFPNNSRQTILIISESGVVNKTIQKINTTGQLQLNISSLEKGMYIIKIISDDKVMHSRFIKL